MKGKHESLLHQAEYAQYCSDMLRYRVDCPRLAQGGLSGPIFKMALKAHRFLKRGMEITT